MDRLRRSMMFVPGNMPSMVRDAHIYGADCLMFDLEDSVPLHEKDAARLLIYNALKTIDYGHAEKLVRINPMSTPFGKRDIEAAVSCGVGAIRIAKTETPEDVLQVDAAIREKELELGVDVGKTKIFAAIESALGVLNAYAIATASPRVVGIALGAEDYCADLRIMRTAEGSELLSARQSIVLAARAAKISAVDTVFSNINDMEGFEREAAFIKMLGFDGKSVINPRQIEPVHKIFAPTQAQIENAKRIIDALKRAEAMGTGVISLDGRMVDRPVVIRAQYVLDMARSCHMLDDYEEVGDE